MVSCVTFSLSGAEKQLYRKLSEKTHMERVITQVVDILGQDCKGPCDPKDSERLAGEST